MGVFLGGVNPLESNLRVGWVGNYPKYMLIEILK